MSEHTWNPAETTAIVFLTGFAIQQSLQIIDPLIQVAIYKYKNSRPNKDLPGGLSDAEFKKAIMALLSFLLGMLVVGLTDIRLLKLLSSNLAGTGDFIVSSLVLGTGTEAVNTVMKFLGYVKDAQKPAPPVDLTIAPSSATVKQGATFQFTAILANSSTPLEWRVLHGDAGGTISNSGLYQAPPTTGTYQVQVRSTTDSSRHAIATVTVS